MMNSNGANMKFALTNNNYGMTMVARISDPDMKHETTEITNMKTKRVTVISDNV